MLAMSAKLLLSSPGIRPTAAAARPVAGDSPVPAASSSAASGVVVGEQAGGDVAQGDDAGAGEGGDVDHGDGVEALGVGERVAQDQAAFGVGVEDLDGLAGHGGDDVAGLDGASRRACSRWRDQADHVDRQLHLRDGLEGAEHAGGAAHVVLHLVHAGAGLEGDAAGVEGDALAHQHHRLVALALPPL
jgi:hypothetical protein